MQTKKPIYTAVAYPASLSPMLSKRSAKVVAKAFPTARDLNGASDADRLITRRIREALGLIDCRCLDHFVLGDGVGVSFAERGWL